MFKTKTLLVAANARVAVLEERSQKDIDRYRELNSEFHQAVRDLEERLRDAHMEMRLLRAQVEDLSQARNKLEIDKAVLLERLDLTTNYLGNGPALTGPKTLTEEAEDAMFAFRQGDLSKSELERELASAGYDNTEIEFELSDYPRHAAEQ